MCGIVGYTGAQNAAPIILGGLKKLEYRGYDSAGIAVMNGGKILISKVKGRILNLCEKTDNGKLTEGCVGIGHTRWATHGAPTDMNDVYTVGIVNIVIVASLVEGLFYRGLSRLVSIHILCHEISKSGKDCSI